MVSENTQCRTVAASGKHESPVPVAVILGPTAAGKSSVALALARKYGWEIISCDSRQLYRGMDIGTAKPSPEERTAVPHWLIDHLDPSEEYSAWRFADEAAAIIRERAKAGKKVVICGGTGLYFRALQTGQTERVPSDPAVRKQLADFVLQQGSAVLHRELTAVDPVTASHLHPNDTQRIIRALALYRQTGKTIADYSGEENPPFDMRFTVVKLAMDRSLLYERINRRVEEMRNRGLRGEFLHLRKAGYDRYSPGMQSVGYKELFEVEEGRSTMDDAAELIKRNTRRYAKRQITWLAHKVEGITVDAADPAEQIDKAEICFREAGLC